METVLNHPLFMPILVTLVIIAAFPLVAGYIVLVERKVLADFQVRLGPMRVGPHGLLQPSEPVRGPGTVARADIVLVPALAVDEHGHRLGRGGGSYDRALARVGGQIPTIALLYDDELLPSVPAEPHDQRVRVVARPSTGLTRTGGPAVE